MAFLVFWHQHGQSLLGTTTYHEIAPHLVRMAFLTSRGQRDGWVERKLAVGQGRLDLRLVYSNVALVIEVKVWRDGPAIRPLMAWRNSIAISRGSVQRPAGS